MRKMKSIFLSLFVLMVFIGSAGATMMTLLPASSHYEGSTYYDIFTDGGYLRGRIDFAVYDTQTYPNEFIGSGGYQMPGTGRYIYTYQIFNDYPASDKAVAYFAILGAGISSANGTSAQHDPADGVEPTDVPSQGAWDFADALIYKDDHSWFLAYSCDYDWVAGEYEIRSTQNDETPVPGLPEPAVLTLLGLGSAVFFLNRRPGRAG